MFLARGLWSQSLVTELRSSRTCVLPSSRRVLTPRVVLRPSQCEVFFAPGSFKRPRFLQPRSRRKKNSLPLLFFIRRCHHCCSRGPLLKLCAAISTCLTFLLESLNCLTSLILLACHVFFFQFSFFTNLVCGLFALRLTVIFVLFFLLVITFSFFPFVSAGFHLSYMFKRLITVLSLPRLLCFPRFPLI